MEETFRDVTPAEAQRVLLQFMGENIGELKTLDSHIINKTSTLNGITLQPGQVIRSIPAPQQQPVVQQPVVQQPDQQQLLSTTAPSTQNTQYDDRQLEFNFNPDHYQEIIKLLNSHTKELVRINNTLADLSDALLRNNNKKKV